MGSQKLSGPALELYQRTSDSSEENWCAGWMRGLEYDLWAVLHDEEPRTSYRLAETETRELLDLSEAARGWIYSGPPDDYDPRLVPFRRVATDLRQTLGDIMVHLPEWAGRRDWWKTYSI